MQKPLIERGDELFLPNPDPAVHTVRGYRRFLVGLDIGQKDRNAFSIILDERVPFYETSVHQELGKRRREIVRAEFVPAMTYPALVQVVRNLMCDKALAGRAWLAVDAGGVGRAFADMLNTAGVQHTRVQIVGGENESEAKERGTSFHNVGKTKLISALSSAFHTGELTIGDFEARDLLRQELESFEADVTAAGRVKIEGGTDFRAFSDQFGSYPEFAK